MFEWINRNKKKFIIIISILSIFLIIIMPYILDRVYYWNSPCKFFNVDYNISNILEYYGAVLTFIGTVSLGIITVYQNYTSQKKTDEINKLTLELQKKSMILAEQNYKKESQNDIKKGAPKFELRNVGCNGMYMNLNAVLKNVSDNFASEIKSISFRILSESNVTVATSDKVQIKAFSLSPGQETYIEFRNNELRSKNLINLYGQQVYEGLKDFKISWEFQCEDTYSDIHYYRALLSVKDSNNFVGDAWLVKRIG